ncbi:MAG: polysaccharide biosynthesis C-terminal domain-containing protein, partial [bacterium]
YFLGSSYSGIYKVALTLAEKLWLVPKAVQSIIFHNSSELWGQNNIIKLSNLFNKSLKYTSLFLTLVGVGLFILAEPFITLIFGADYLSAVLPLQILIIGTLGFGIARIFLSTFAATSWLKVSQVITIIVTIVNVLLNYFFIPIYGITGAATATSFTYFLMLVLSLYYYFNNDLKFILEYDIKKITVLTFSFFASYYVVDYIIAGESAFYLIIIALVGFFMFLALSYLLGLFSKKEFNFILSLMRK